MATPASAPPRFQFPTGRTPRGPADADAEAQVRRARARLQPPLRQQLVLQRQLHAEPALGQLRGPRLLRRSHDADARAARSATAQQQAGSISRPGGNVNRAWDLDELLWDSNGNLDVTGRLGDGSSARRQAVRRVRLPVRHADRRVLLRAPAARRSPPTSPRRTRPT